MTRFLSDSLQVGEPHFRLGLRALEAATGRASADIRLTNELKQQLKIKFKQLGLDAADTTPAELYQVLQQRLERDEGFLIRRLQTEAATHISADAKVEAGMTHVLQTLVRGRTAYSLKPSSFKGIVSKLPPKKTMKQLGYRSIASFLKHETPAAILTAAAVFEDENWQHKLTASYKKLSPRDFEVRSVSVVLADCHKWQEAAENAVVARKQNVLCFKELGVVSILPVPATMPVGSAVASLALAVLAINELYATAVHWKLAQVRPDFGIKVQESVASEAGLNAGLLGRPLSWHLIQRFFSELKEHFNEALFEPHVLLEDMDWHNVEDVLSQIDSRFSFWQGTSYLGVLHGRHPVSCNILDVAFNRCHGLSFEKRLVHNFQHSLWQELLLRYLQPDMIEKTIISELHPQLATEYAIA